MRLTLTADELVNLTGFKRARNQVAWIREHYGIRAILNSLDEAIVVRAHLEAAARPEQNDRPRKEIASKRTA